MVWVLLAIIFSGSGSEAVAGRVMTYTSEKECLAQKAELIRDWSPVAKEQKHRLHIQCYPALLTESNT